MERYWVKWYKTANWAKLRKWQLSREPLCRFCKADGKTTSGRDVDHIQDHKGDMNLFFDKENLQTLCKSCHSKKTISENSPVRGATLIPQWMPKSKKPFSLVCGPPASGKSYYVESNKNDSDLVIDLDIIAKDLGFNLWEVTKEKRWEAIRERNRLIADYFNGKTKHSYCWIIAVASCPEHIKFWQDRGGDVKVMKSDNITLKKRLIARGRGLDYYNNAMISVNKWGNRCLSCKLCDFGCDTSGIVPGWR